MAYAVFGVLDKLQDHRLPLEQGHWLFQGICANYPQRVRYSHAHCAHRSSVQNDVLGESHCICHLAIVQLENWRVQEAKDGWSLLRVDVETAGYEIDDQT